MGDGLAKATPRPLYPHRRVLGEILKVGLWGRCGSVWRRKDLSLPLGFEPQTIQSVASGYSYNAILRSANQSTITCVALCLKKPGSPCPKRKHYPAPGIYRAYTHSLVWHNRSIHDRPSHISYDYTLDDLPPSHFIIQVTQKVLKYSLMMTYNCRNM
jgi:hypothetical protein